MLADSLAKMIDENNEGKNPSWTLHVIGASSFKGS